MFAWSCKRGIKIKIAGVTNVADQTPDGLGTGCEQGPTIVRSNDVNNTLFVSSKRL